MPRAAVRDSELDLSTRVPSFPGVYGAIVIPATRGPVNEPVLVSSDSDFLRKFTPDERIEVGYDVSYFSALAYLQKSDKLWVSRAAHSPLFGGLAVRVSTGATGATGPESFSLSTGLADPTAYVFDSTDITGVAEETSITMTNGASFGATGIAKYFKIHSPDTSYYVWMGVTGVDQTSPGVTGCTAVPVVLESEDTATEVAVKVALALDNLADFVAPVPSTSAFVVTNAALGDVTDATAETSGVSITVNHQGVDASGEDDECMFIHGLNPGDWNTDVYVSCVSYETNPDLVKEESCFILNIFKSGNLAAPVESFLLSRVKGKKDGYGVNVYVEDRIQSSNYVRIINNPAVTGTYPKDISTPINLGGGSDGEAVSDAEMIAAAQKFKNPSDVFFTILLDGGWTNPAYQLELDSITSTRKDSVAILSVPYSAEAGSDTDYLSNVITFRKSTLNLNSSWSALYSPHCKVYDRFNDRNLFVSPDGYAGAIISATAANFELWYPPAGWRRGVVGKVLDLRRRYTDTDMDMLCDNGINPLRYVPGKGIVIWGQKTLLSRPSSLDRLNVRLMIIAVVPAIKEALEDFCFEFNDTATQNDVSSIINRSVERVQTRKGLYGFSVVCDSSNNTPDDIDNYRLNVDLFMSPTKSVEDIRLRTIITKTGADFVV